MKTIAKLMALFMLLGTLAIAQEAKPPADNSTPAAASDKDKDKDKKVKKEKKKKKEKKSDTAKDAEKTGEKK
jgi:hypothetical protein